MPSTVLFSCPRFDVRQEDIELASGGVEQLFYIDSRGGVVILPILDEDHILMQKQYRHTVGDFCWELPAGGIDMAESPIQAARRELKEETGLTALDLKELGRFYPSNGISNEVVHMFVTEELQGVPTLSDNAEGVDLRQFTVNEAMSLLLEHKIPGASSMLALLLYFRGKY